MAAKPESVTHQIDRERRIVHVTITGDVSVDTLHSARDAVLGDPAFVPGMDVCIECRVLTALPTADEIRSLALSAILNRAESRVGRIAIVTTTARTYEAAGLFELFTDAPPNRLAVFTDPTQARAWLALGARPTAS